MSPSSAEASRIAQQPGEKILLWGAMVLTAGAPALIGGAMPVVQVLLSALALALLVGYVLLRGKRGLRPLPFATAAGVALAFTVLQLVPLPAPLVGLLSPRAYELRAELAPGARFMSLTVDVPATLLAAARGIGCLALLVVVGGIIDSRRRVARMLTVVAATSGGLAVIAMVQRLVGTTAILGFYRPRSMPGFGVFGTFVDVNHAASVLELGALVAAGLALSASGRARVVFITMAALSTGALLFTASRGALLGFAVGGFLFTAVMTVRSVGPARGLIAATVLLLLAVAVTLWTSEALRQRFSENPQQLADNQKTRGWRDGLALAADYPWTGVGRGAFEAPATKYRRRDEGIRLVYPENILVQMASEWGIAVTLALLGMVLTTAVRLSPAIARAGAPIVGAAGAVVAVSVHELTDFGTELPGVAFPVVVTLAVVVGRLASEQRRLPRAHHRRLSMQWSLPLAGVAALTIAGAAWASRHTLDEDFARLHVGSGVDESALQTAIARHPADDYLELLAAQQSLKAGRADAMHHINRALRLHPANWQAHRMAAVLLTSLKRPAQAALEYRLALSTGMGFDALELHRRLGAHVVDAVPQTTPMLFELARALYASGNAELADTVAQRAVDVADARPRALLDRAQLALASSVSPVAGRAARALLAEADSVDAFATAARGLALAGSPAESNAALKAGMKQFPRDVTLELLGAELRLAAGDLDGAYALLSAAGKFPLSLADRQRVEDLLAQWADKSGDQEAAVMARARSRLIEKQLRDIRQIGKAD